METYREHPRHCKLWRYGARLHGMVGKDATRHQSRPTSCYEVICCEPLLDFVLLRRCMTRMLLPRSHVKRVSLVRGFRGPVSEGGHLSPRLPHCHLGWDLRLLCSLLPSRLVTLRSLCCYEPQIQTRVSPRAVQHTFIELNLIVQCSKSIVISIKGSTWLSDIIAFKLVLGVLITIFAPCISISCMCSTIYSLIVEWGCHLCQRSRKEKQIIINLKNNSCKSPYLKDCKSALTKCNEKYNKI